jgi:mannose-6-phosphate isomerase
VVNEGPALFGRHHPQPQFPLLFKFLDCQKTLSVQVHPNDEQAARLDPPDLGKTEAWVVLGADPGSKIYAGLKPGVDRNRLKRAIDEGKCEECLHQFEPKVGDCVFIEAGTVHALGAGLLIAEIQQASDTTYRLFDWNRVDRDGKPRALHIEESLATIDYSRGPVDPVKPRTTDIPHVERLVSCDKFVLDRRTVAGSQSIASTNRFRILSAIEGDLSLLCAGDAKGLKRGDTILIPAASPDVELSSEGRAVALEMHLP